MTSNHSQTNVRFCRVVFYILLCGVFILAAYSRANALESPLARQTIKTIIVDNYAPYTYVNEQGQPDGFSVDLMKTVAQVMGFNLDIKVDTWAHAVSALENGDIDFLPMMAYSAERDKTFDFSPPHTIAYDAFFTRQDSGAIHSMDDLAGKTIIVMENDQAHQALKSIPSIKAEQLLLVDSLPEALQLLASGKGDTALMPKLVGLLLIRDLNLANLEPSPVVVEAYNRPFSFAVKSGNQAMLERLNQGMSIAKATGQYDEIYKKWFGALKPAGAYNEILMTYLREIMLAVALIGAILLLWTFLLRRQVAARTQSLKLEMQEHKRAEEALRESKAIFSSFLEYSPVYVFFKDKEIRSLMLSKNYEQMLGMPISDLLGKTMDDLFPSDLAKSMIADDLKILNEGKRVTVLEEFNGRTYETTKFPVLKDGKPHILAGFTLDITERKQAEETIKSKLNELRRWQDVTLGREGRVQELKREVNELCRRAGEPARYHSQETSSADSKTGEKQE